MLGKFTASIARNSVRGNFTGRIQTGRLFSTMQSDQLRKSLAAIVGQSNVMDGDTSTLQSYRPKVMGKAACVVRPETTDEVSEILKFCNEHRIGVVPQGGNSGLVQASTPDKSGTQIVLSTQILNNGIFEPDRKQRLLRVGAGLVLDNINEKLADSGLWLPIDFGASGSANIGGMISTNTAGTRAGRYGNVKSRTKEITVVLANGEIKKVKVNHNNIDPELPQDNSRLDPDNPFIGSGGWLGVVTEAEMMLEDIPAQSRSMVLVPTSIADMNKIRHVFKERFGDKFTAFEIMSDTALKLVAKHTPDTRYLLEGVDGKTDEHEYALLLEVSSLDKDEDLSGQLDNVLIELMENGIVATGLLGNDEVYWHHRHHITDAIAREAKSSGLNNFSTDIAVRRVDNLTGFLQETPARIMEKFPGTIIASFGHGMLGAEHFNGITPHDVKKLQEFIYDIAVNEYKGTYSTEHGIGGYNRWAYDKYSSLEQKQTAEDFKRKYDPNSILNPSITYGFAKGKDMAKGG